MRAKRRKRKSCELKNSNWTLETKVGRVVCLLINLLFKIIHVEEEAEKQNVLQKDYHELLCTYTHLPIW